MSELIVVSGEAAAGKTTLIRGALSEYPDKLEYLVTHTTRRPRKESEPEYIFVSKDEYTKRRLASAAWDHSEIYGNYYGCDISAVHQVLGAGTSLVVATKPDAAVMHEFRENYDIDPIGIYIKTERRLRLDRLMGRGAVEELVRIQEDDIMTTFEDFADVVFATTNNIEEDMKNFNEIIGEYLL